MLPVCKQQTSNGREQRVSIHNNSNLGIGWHLRDNVDAGCNSGTTRSVWGFWNKGDSFRDALNGIYHGDFQDARFPIARTRWMSTFVSDFMYRNVQCARNHGNPEQQV